MKFEREGSSFKPVTITLDSEDEVRLLAVALSKISGNGVDQGLIYSLYRQLTYVSDYAGYYEAAIVGANKAELRKI